MVETGQQSFQISMTGNVDAEDFACDTTVEAFDHPVGLRCVWLGHAMQNGNAFLVAARKTTALAAFSAS